MIALESDGISHGSVRDHGANQSWNFEVSCHSRPLQGREEVMTLSLSLSLSL
jgi:hypothetical protein